MKNFFLIVFLISFSQSYSQVADGQAVYELKVNLHKRLKPEDEKLKEMMPEFKTQKMQLLFNKYESYYKEFEDEDDDIQQALDKFKAVNLMSLPVVNSEHNLVGTLALYEVVEWFKGATDPRNSWQHYVHQIMSHRVVTVDPLQPIQDLIPYFVEKSFNYIPVVENQRLIGMISRADMIAALQQQLNRQKLQSE